MDEGRRRALALLSLTALAVSSPARPARSETLELRRLEAYRADQGLWIDFETAFDLPETVEDALHKGIALHFVAEVSFYRSRWYWRDKLVAHASRTWRISHQPLLSSYRVSLGGLGQTFRTLPEALSAIQSASRWRVGDAPEADEDARYYAEFSYRLERDMLPRPLQIGVGSLPDWTMRVDRTVPVGAR